MGDSFLTESSWKLVELWRMENGLSARVRISDLGQFNCRWITKETPFEQEYCGCVTHNGSSWCEEHWNRVYGRNNNSTPVPDQCEPLVAQRERPGLHVKALREMALRGERRVLDAETRNPS